MRTFVVVYAVHRLGEKIETIYERREDFQRAGVFLCRFHRIALKPATCRLGALSCPFLVMEKVGEGNEKQRAVSSDRRREWKCLSPRPFGARRLGKHHLSCSTAEGGRHLLRRVDVVLYVEKKRREEERKGQYHGRTIHCYPASR